MNKKIIKSEKYVIIKVDERGMAWHGEAWRGRAWRGKARQGFLKR